MLTLGSLSPSTVKAQSLFQELAEIEVKNKRCSADPKQNECKPTPAGLLVHLCNDANPDTRPNCLGSISGIYLAMTYKGELPKCVPDNLNAEQIRLLLLRQATRNPEMLHHPDRQFIKFTIAKTFC